MWKSAKGKIRAKITSENFEILKHFNFVGICLSIWKISMIIQFYKCTTWFPFILNVHIWLSIWFLTLSEACSDLRVWIKASYNTVKMIVTCAVCFAFFSWVALSLIWGIQVCVTLTTPCFNLFCSSLSPGFEV